jgi:hypothetical protein
MRDLFRRLFGGSSDLPPSGAGRSGDDTYSALRRQALSVRRAEVGIPAPSPEAPVWGVLMETGYHEGTATLIALGDGTTSLYLSTGGGVVGGHAHQDVRQANAEFVETANRFRRHLEPTDSFPLAAKGYTIFYVLTDSGVLTGGGREEDLGLERDTLSPLFHAGHRVIAQLRSLSEGADQNA